MYQALTIGVIVGSMAVASYDIANETWGLIARILLGVFSIAVALTLGGGQMERVEPIAFFMSALIVTILMTADSIKDITNQPERNSEQ